VIACALNEKLRNYINKKWPLHTYGKIKEVIEAALTEYLKKEGV